MSRAGSAAGVVLALVTSVASAYVSLRARDRQLEIATSQNYAEVLRIFEPREGGGVASQVELSQIRSWYQQALAAIPAILADLRSDLLERRPGVLTVEPEAPAGAATGSGDQASRSITVTSRGTSRRSAR